MYVFLKTECIRAKTDHSKDMFEAHVIASGLLQTPESSPFLISKTSDAFPPRPYYQRLAFTASLGLIHHLALPRLQIYKILCRNFQPYTTSKNSK